MKKIFSIAIVITLIFVMAASPLSAVEARVANHYIPGTMVECTTIPTLRHTRYIGVYEGAHQLADGTVCHYTAVRWEHQVACSSCGYIASTYTADCQVQHDTCGQQSHCPA